MYRQVLEFWFEEISPSQWWQKNDELDRLVAARFADLHHRATGCELYEWRATAEGRLAEVLVLDQFSRNLCRGSPLAFANDGLALALAQEAISVGADKQLEPLKCSVLYLPFMHSESSRIHAVAVELYTRNGIAANLEFELQHKAIIDRFSRYPHRNEVLGRDSTAEELQFLQQPGSSF